jgi:hypothetical protein
MLKPPRDEALIGAGRALEENTTGRNMSPKCVKAVLRRLVFGGINYRSQMSCLVAYPLGDGYTHDST